MTARGSLLAGVPDHPLTEERFDTLVETRGVTVERIVSTGQTAPETGWFDQPHDEWVCLIEGHARLVFDAPAEEMALAPGDWVHIPAHCRHRVTATRAAPATIWLAVHIR